MRRSLSVFVLSGAAVVASSACQKEETAAPPPENVCKESQAISANAIGGASLPAKTIALTFDDGPGNRTAELSNYLKAQGIRAAFFVNGVQVPGRETVLQTIVSDGHVLANHAQTHVNLTTLTAPQVVKELSDTDAIIAPFVPANRFLFRAPYGAFNAATFAAIDGSPMKKYVGTITWEIGDSLTATSAADWDCWDAPNGTRTTAQCGDLYIQEIEAKGSGIVLMHDIFGGASGNTVDMVKYMVPLLKGKGFSFARIDEVPEIAALLPPLPPEDAGVEAGAPQDAGTTSSGGPPPPVDAAAPTPPDPCAPGTSATHRGESGHLLR
jgi:peptidoglycan-N-acetylglucosamine deacetylase